MPVIIKHGDTEKTKPKHLQLTFRCYNCGCEFKLEPSDRVKHTDNGYWSTKDQREAPEYWTADCPECGKSVMAS